MSVPTAEQLEQKSTFQARLEAAQRWPLSESLTFANHQQHRAILFAVQATLGPPRRALKPPPILSEYRTSLYLGEGGDGLMEENESSDPGFGYIDIDRFSLLVGDEVYVFTSEREDEKCPPESTTTFTIRARSPTALAHAREALEAWHAQHPTGRT